MPRKNNTDVPTEFIDCFTLRVYRSFEPMRFEVVIPEMDCRFTSTELAATLANATQGLLFHLFEKQKRVEQLQPGHPV